MTISIRSLIGAVALLQASIALTQQQFSGRVVDPAGRGLAFANIRHDNTPVIADAQGRFSLALNTTDSIDLFVSTLGHASRKVRVAGAGPRIEITLSEQVTDLPAFTTTASITGGSGPSREMAGSAWYIGPREIQRSGHTDPHRLLRSVPGVNIQEEDGFGLRPNIGLRGAGSERSSKITMMEDGVLMAPAPYASPAAYFFPSVARMHAIEVVKGSSQLRYGPLTTGGAINFISTPLPDRTGGKVGIWGGSYGTRNMHATAGAITGPWQVLVETVQQAADGFKQLDNGGATGFNKQDYMIKAGWSNNAGAKWPMAFALKGGYTTELSNETYLGLSQEDFSDTPFRRYAGSAQDRMEVRHDLLSANYAVTIPGGPQVVVTAYRTNTFRNWYKLDQLQDSTGGKAGIGSVISDPVGHAEMFATVSGSTSTDNALLVKANNRNYQASGVQLLVNQQWARPKATHKAQLGVRLHKDYMDRFQWQDGYAMRSGTMFLTSAGKPGSESNRVASAQALALHAVYDLTIGKLSVHPGVRMERIDMADDNYGKQDPYRSGSALVSLSNTREVWLPGISVDHRVLRDLLAFAGVHRGFSPAGADASTRPESSTNYEAGLRWNSDILEVQAIGFHTDYNELLGADLAAAGGTGSGDLFNGGAATVTGVEVSASYDPLRGKSSAVKLPVRISYTWTDARFRSSFNSSFEPWGQVIDGDRIPFTPEHQLHASAALEARRVALALSATYVGATVTATGAKAEEDNSALPAYTVLDADATFRMGGGADLFATVQNLLNAVYAVGDLPAGWRPGMPRTIQAGVRVRF